MTLDEFFKHFCEEIDVLDLTNVEPSTDFKKIEGWDSLNALLVIAMIEEKINIRITGDDMRNCKTVEDLYKLIQSKSQ